MLIATMLSNQVRKKVTEALCFDRVTSDMSELHLLAVPGVYS